MSLRHLKKVFESEDLLPVPADASSDEEVLQIQPANHKSSKKKARQKIRNKFELLAEMEMSAEHDEEGGGVEGDHEDPAQESGEESSKKSARKKPKKKKKKQSHATDTVDREEEASSCNSASGNRTNQETKAKTNQEETLEEFELSNEEREAIMRKRKLEELFAIDPKLLNPENELKKMFGSKVIRHEKSGTRFHNNNQHRRNLLSRRGRLVYPKEHRIFNGASGITLELLSTDERTGCKIFKFGHSQGYRDVQRQFLAAVNTYNPDSIVNLMRAHPYHIDAHIQLSDMAKHSEDMQIASELVEDGINYLQNTFDHQFDICSPFCQMPYKYQENRSLHILLFKYLVFLGQRGCPRTALQLCKKLLSLDPDNDPLCVTLMIDFYSLKSKEFVWLCDLYELWNAERNLNQLPNWAYSIALAYFMRRNEHPAADSKQPSKASSIKTADKDEDWEAKSNELLQYALLMFPSVLLPLLEKCGIQSDSKVINHWYFVSTISSKQTKSLNLLCDLYVWRTHHLWRDAAILRWLEFNTQAVISQIDQDKKITNGFVQKRQRRYAGTPYNILRHVIVTDSKDITIPLPQELSKKPVLSFDPIRPHNAIDIYNYDQPDPSRPSGETVNANNGLLSMLFRSLVFDLNAMQGQAPRDGGGRLAGGNGNELAGAGVHGHVAAQARAEAEAHEAEENAQAQAGMAGIHDSVNTLLNAMRDLLQVVTPAGVGAAAAAPDEEDSSEDDSEQD